MAKSFGAPASREPAFALRVEPASGLAASRINPARSLAQVLREIAAAQRAFDASWGLEREGELLDRLCRLSDEARAIIETATGVSWEQISGACL